MREIDIMADGGFVSDSRGVKSVYLTEEGIEKARELARRYLKEDNDKISSQERTMVWPVITTRMLNGLKQKRNAD